MTYNQLSKNDINERLRGQELEVLDDYKSTKEVATFRCLICGKEFKAKYDLTRTWKYPGCDECRKKFVLCKKKNEREKHREELLNNRLSDNVEIISYYNDTYMCKCLLCGDLYTTSYDSLLQGSMHKKCASKISQIPKRLTLEDIQKHCTQNGMHLTLECEEENGIIKYHCDECGYKGKKSRKLLMRKRGCPECGKLNARLNKCRPINDISPELERYDLHFITKETNDVLPITRNTKIVVQCDKCLFQFVTSLYYIEKYNMICPICKQSNKRCESFNKHQAYIASLNPHLHFEYNENYINERLEITCDECGKTFYRLLADLKKYPNCPICTTNSVLEENVSRYLRDHQIDYVHSYKFDDLYGINNGQLSYDFYLPNQNILIECQGVQHEHPISYFGGETQFKIQQEHDKRKREYAKEHMINLIEIWYYESNDVNKILSNVLNINDIERTA